MRCRNCNGELRFEDKFCPYCGTKNIDAMRHQKDMEKFKKDYESVKKDVLDTAATTTASRTRIFANLVLLVCVLLIPLLMTFIAMFVDDAITSKPLTKEEETIFMNYIEDEEYVKAYHYSNSNDFYYKVDYDDELNFYIDSAYHYTEVYYQLLAYIEHDYITDDYYENDVDKNLIQTITFYYDNEARLRDKTTYSYIEEDYTDGLEFLEKMNKEIEDLLFTFLEFDVTQEEYSQMGNNNKLAAVERSIYGN